MLAVQVQYLNLQELKRHDLETEKLGFQTLAETHRSNIVRETQEWTKIDQNQQSINEAVRHNRATESIQLITANAQAMNAQTNRMLANAQIPLVNAQTEKTKKEKELVSQKYQTEQYNTMVAQSNANWADWLNLAKTVNEVIPF